MSSLLPPSNAGSTRSASVNSRNSSTRLKGGGAKVKVTIPSTGIRTDTNGKLFTIFILNVRADVPSIQENGTIQFETKRWVVERRFSEFLRLHVGMRNRLPQLRVLPFPSKAYLFNMSTSTVRHRQNAFQQYLDIVTSFTPIPPEIFAFLDYSFHHNHGRSHPSIENRPVSLEDFTLVKVIGQGSFGKVFLVRPNWDNSTDTVFAMKVVKKEDVRRRNQLEHTMAERRIMAQIRHPFIVPLIFAFQSQEKLYMVTEYCSGGELFFHLKRLKRFKEKDARFYIAEVACALSHLHAYDVIYRDLKPENILLDGEGHVKLTDFGLSKDDVFGDNELGAASESYPNSPRMSDASGGEHRHSTVLPTTRTFCGTPEYLAPEMILNRKRHTGYSLAIDWWSLGIVAYEMLTGWPPFFDRNFNVMCEKILRKPVKLPSKYKISENCADFVCKGLLQRDPLLRLGNTADGFSGIEKHPYFNDLNWNDLRSRQVTPPFVPPRGHGRPEEDVRNVDKEFLKMAALDTPTNPSSLINGALDKSDPDFKDFSFVDSVLS